MTTQRDKAAEWFKELRKQIIASFELIEEEYADVKGLKPAKFEFKEWERPGGGGGQMGIMRGNVFEKVGVNFSAVHGQFSPIMSREIPGADENPNFFATGISLVSHMKSPLVPAAHFNTRYIETQKSWFGGGGDLTPMYEDEAETKRFHEKFKTACDKHNPNYYQEFKKRCDEYFYLEHRKEPRGVGGIFYDYLNTGNFEKDFAFTQDVGKALRDVYPDIIRNKFMLDWTDEQRAYQLQKRGRYVEFNLLYDRGTKFGLMTDGNIEAILMSMPPIATW